MSSNFFIRRFKSEIRSIHRSEIASKNLIHSPGFCFLFSHCIIIQFCSLFLFFLFFCFPFLIHGKKRKFHPLKHYTFPSQTNQLPFSNNLLHLTFTKKKKKSHRSNLLKSDIRWYHRRNFLPLSFNVQSFASVACKYGNMHGKRGVQRLSPGTPSLISATPDSRAQ